MKHLVLCLALISACGTTFAEETTGEKAETKMDDAKRSMKKTGHHIEEAVCAEGDAKCAAKKAKHRVKEGGDYMKDKAKETKDKMD